MFPLVAIPRQNASLTPKAACPGLIQTVPHQPAMMRGHDLDRPPVVLDIDPFVVQAVLREVAAERPEADRRDAGLHDRIADVARGVQRIDMRRGPGGRRTMASATSR